MLFINDTLAKEVGSDRDKVLSIYTKCNSILKSTLHANCTKCPREHFLGIDGPILNLSLSWENENHETNKWFLVRDSIIKWIDGRDVIIETATDITRQKRIEIQLQMIASKDMMTDTYNREWGARIIRGLIEHSKELHSLTFIDLDCLKYVNDFHGHDAGDFFILKTVESIKSCIRKDDALSRWGGDEFILITHGSAKAAETVIKRIKSKLEKYNALQERPYELNFSYGIVEMDPTKQLNFDDLIVTADDRMYKNKMTKQAYQ
jgi:diguanylate cyclase (GGDEF)-like protein